MESLSLVLSLLGVALGAAALVLLPRAQGAARRAEEAAERTAQLAANSAEAAATAGQALAALQTELASVRRDLAEMRTALDVPPPPLPKGRASASLEDLREQLRAAQAEDPDAEEETP